MKPLFIKKNGTVSKVSGIIMNLIPSYTLAEYNALTHKPLLWIRTDEEYAQIPSEDVSYGSGSVKDVLDLFSPTSYRADGMTFTDCTRISGGYLLIGNLFILNIRIEVNTASSSTKQYLTLPKTALALSAILAENASDDTAPIYSVVSQNGVYLRDTVANKGYALFGIFIVQ